MISQLSITTFYLNQNQYVDQVFQFWKYGMRPFNPRFAVVKEIFRYMLRYSRLVIH